jgi:xanthine/uracil permease
MLKLVRLFYQRIWLYTLGALVLLSIAAQGDVPEFGSLEEFLVWVGAGGGGMVLSGLVIAYFLENLAFWHGLPRAVKLIVPIALAGLFGFLAQSVLAAELLTMVPPVVQGVVLMLIGWLFSQIGYKSIKEGDYAASARIGPDG